MSSLHILLTMLSLDWFDNFYGTMSIFYPPRPFHDGKLSYTWYSGLPSASSSSFSVDHIVQWWAPVLFLHFLLMSTYRDFDHLLEYCYIKILWNKCLWNSCTESEFDERVLRLESEGQNRVNGLTQILVKFGI